MVQMIEVIFPDKKERDQTAPTKRWELTPSMNASKGESKHVFGNAFRWFLRKQQRVSKSETRRRTEMIYNHGLSQYGTPGT